MEPEYSAVFGKIKAYVEWGVKNVIHHLLRTIQSMQWLRLGTADGVGRERQAACDDVV